MSSCTFHRLGVKRIMSTRLLRGLAVVTLVVGTVAFVAGTAQAQSPTPNWYMMDTPPRGPFPPEAPYQTHTANAVVVFGWGSLTCVSAPYTQINIENSTTYWMTHGDQVVTNLNPQSACSGGSIAPYETEIHAIEQDVESKGTDPGRYWGGFMLDEEPGYGFTKTQLESLNSYVNSLMSGTPGLSWYFTEDQPNGWDLSTYHQIVTGSWLAPQVYTTSMLAAVNTGCSIYSMCENDVTVSANTGATWGDYRTVTGEVNGTPWYNSVWGSGYWCNEYVYAG